jgi:glycine betaine/proline transport system substrate-binding protein
MTSRQWRAFRASALSLAALLGAALTGPAHAAGDPASCQEVHFADVGWSDVTATTSLVMTTLEDLGYTPRSTLVSVPVTYESMKAGRIDAFLGNWMPAQVDTRRPYIEDGSIEIVRANLTGAKFTLAVPDYLYAAGLHDFRDIHRYADALGHRIYGIEPGNNGNRIVQGLIDQNAFALGDFRLVDSSEQGMLAEVDRAIAARAPIVFLAWEPHPMNMHFPIRYLTGGDATFGPNYGGATVWTLVRHGLAQRCPNLGRLLANVEFTTRGEDEVMLDIQSGTTGEAAARRWLAAHPAVRASWLEGVTTFDGRAPASHSTARHGLSTDAIETFLTAHKIPVGAAIARAIDGIKTRGAGIFGGISAATNGAVALSVKALRSVPATGIVIGFAVLAWWLQRSWKLVVFVVAALLFIINQGYWSATLETLALVIVAALITVTLGVPLGILAAHRPRLHAALRPVLDLMQTLPTFVYLIPTLVLFGLGVVPAIISTVIFALPAPVRLTQLGISSTPKALLEAGDAFGATPWQRLIKIELPSALPLILEGVTQCIMLCLSMVVIAALVGAGGLGVPVVRALNTVQVGMGFEAGLAIVLLAIVLDRISRRRGKH